MKVNRCLAILIGVAVSGSAMAANWVWDGDAAPDTSWVNPTNWNNNTMYTDNLPILDTGDFATVEPGTDYSTASAPLRIGQNGAAELQVVGGDLTILNNVYMGYLAAAGHGTLTVNSGSFTTTGNMIFGNNGAPSGTLNLNGGAVNIAGGLQLPATAGTYTIGLNDGTLTCGAINPGSGANIDMTIGSGTWLIESDERNDIGQMLFQGQLSADPGLSINVDYDEVLTNTTVTATATPTGDTLLISSPGALLTLELDAPSTIATGDIVVGYLEGALLANVEVSDILIGEESNTNAFTLTSSTAFSLTDAVPSNETVSIQFDNTVAGLTHSEFATGTVFIVWNEVGNPTSQTNQINLRANFTDSPASFDLDPALVDLLLSDPSTTITGTVVASYVEAQTDATNVIVSALSISNASHAGFTILTGTPLDLVSPAPNSSDLNVMYDNTVGGLADGETATADLVVTWQEAGGVEQEEIVPFTVTYAAAIQSELIIDPDMTSFAGNVRWLERQHVDNGWYTRNAAWTLDASGEGFVKNLVNDDAVAQASAITFMTGGVLTVEFDWTPATNAVTADDLTLRYNCYAWFDDTGSAAGDDMILLDTEKKAYSLSGNSGLIDFADNLKVYLSPAPNKKYAIDTIVGVAGVTTNVVIEYDVSGLAEAVNDVGDWDFWGIRFETPAAAIAGGKVGNVSAWTVPPVVEGPDSVNDITMAIDGSDLITCFIGEEYGTYALQSCGDLVTANWTNVGDTVTGVGDICLTNSISAEQAFFRIKLEE
ncbi:hypothetical protein [Pontiella sulfatireligans]|uniref:Uncharacterized protein n=1 Tax=Pontiella sulfatireligans TaxID=2750658 RepID=A0A6C2UIW7_9BACT|nr:hypothetical protein [Pontiella sulfatireligans]VGO19361.1 hypothetical protein SCARR_01419 [Pontiella sulfatireligans]